ncbi:MAG: YicC/YloC family endoribonuclease [Gemmatimonadota bacterium]|nr:YicC/YloC family endoribonuclease [Gemmatimonadota bacterium]
MIRSMTGFGSAAFEADGVRGSLELRSVNSRHLKLNFRLPHWAEPAEEAIREVLHARLSRGHVDVTVRGETTAVTTGPAVDVACLDAYLALFRRLRDEHGIVGEPDLSLVAQLDGVLVEGDADAEEGADPGVLAAAAARALEELLEMRRREGARLAEELRARLAAIGERVKAAEQAAPQRLEAERDRLRQAVAELTGELHVDEDRLAREIAILADRWDVREEIVRARAHLAAFEELLDLPEEEPVGKRFGFLSQELLREINTIGSKANDAGIARQVVEAKNELETLREQIENVE